MGISMKLKYPKTVAACQAAELSQWTIGEALLQECGPPGEDSSHNGSGSKIAEAAAELLTNGIEYSVESLRNFRDVAYAFPPGRRQPGVSYTCHEEARNPQTLQNVIAGLPKGTKLTKRVVRETVTRFYEEAEMARKAKLDKATRKVNALKSAGASEHDITAAKRDASRYVRPTRKSDVEIEPERVPIVLASLQIDGLIADARRALAEAEHAAGDRKSELSEVQIDYIIKCAQECETIARKIIERVKLRRAATPVLRVVT